MKKQVVDLILVIWIWKLYHDWFVAKCRDNLIFESICCEFETGCIDTWMTAKVWFLHDILVDQKLDFVFMLIHQSHDADRSGSNIKIFFHTRHNYRAAAGTEKPVGKSSYYADNRSFLFICQFSSPMPIVGITGLLYSFYPFLCFSFFPVLLLNISLTAPR